MFPKCQPGRVKISSIKKERKKKNPRKYVQNNWFKDVNILMLIWNMFLCFLVFYLNSVSFRPTGLITLINVSKTTINNVDRWTTMLTSYNKHYKIALPHSELSVINHSWTPTRPSFCNWQCSKSSSLHFALFSNVQMQNHSPNNNPQPTFLSRNLCPNFPKHTHLGLLNNSSATTCLWFTSFQSENNW